MDPYIDSFSILPKTKAKELKISAGIEYEISGGDAEAESEPGKEPDSQRIRHHATFQIPFYHLYDSFVFDLFPQQVQQYRMVQCVEIFRQVEHNCSFNRIWKERDSAEPDLLGRILDKDNLNRAYKRVKANKGAPGVDGMTIEEALPWLRENNHELIERIRRGKYTPSPVRRVEIPKPEAGIRKLGIPTVIDRIIQQAIASFAPRPGR